MSTVAEALRSIAESAGTKNGALAKCLRAAEKAAKRGAFTVRVGLSETDWHDDGLRHRLRDDYGFEVETEYSADLLSRFYGIRLRLGKQP